MSSAERTVFQFTDEGVGRDPERPRFARLIADVAAASRTAEEPSLIVVSELSRLFRNGRDRATIDSFVRERVADVASVREAFDTSEPAGRARYTRAAELLMLAYEGKPLPAGTRAELIDRYVDGALDAWLELVQVHSAERRGPVDDVRRRLRALARHCDGPTGTLLLAPFLELAENHEPRDAALEARALALVGVRNSDLETLHLAGHIAQYDWQVLTRAAANALGGLPDLPVGDCDGEDPFEGVVEAHPTAAAAFAALRGLTPGEGATWEPPTREAPTLELEIAAVPVNADGADVLHAMDSRLPQRLADVLHEYRGNPGAFAAPALKPISRNPHKLFAVVDYVLACGGEVLTANLHLRPGMAERRETLVSYNDRDFAWTGLDTAGADAKLGRNDPCPCGSGRKYKRCCGG